LYVFSFKGFLLMSFLQQQLVLPAAGDFIDRGFIGGEGLWYAGMTTAREAESRVLGLPVGAFVVRKTANGYYLCVSYENSARQIAITSSPVCWFTGWVFP
jgi:hypothetical protein